MIKFKNMSWKDKNKVLQNVSEICKNHNLKCVIDTPEHKSYIFLPLIDGWHCKYPELDMIIEKYNLYNYIKLEEQN